MLVQPLLAHPAERGGIYTTWHPDSGDDDDGNQHDDEADDEQHGSAVTESLSRRMAIVAFVQPSVCALVHRLQVSGHVPDGTARIARAAQTEVVSNETKPESLSDVKPGDVLVSHPTAVREHAISVVPNAPHAMSPTHDAALRDGRSAAAALGVDAWLTEDQTHVVKIASHRAPDE